jgi:hypothetical protein
VRADITQASPLKLPQGVAMLWKFLKLQAMLDALFDEGWCGLGLPEAAGSDAQMGQDLAANL